MPRLCIRFQGAHAPDQAVQVPGVPESALGPTALCHPHGRATRPSLIARWYQKRMTTTWTSTRRGLKGFICTSSTWIPDSWKDGRSRGSFSTSWGMIASSRACAGSRVWRTSLAPTPNAHPADDRSPSLHAIATPKLRLCRGWTPPTVCDLHYVLPGHTTRPERPAGPRC